MLTIARDEGLCVIYATSSRSTIEMTISEVEQLMAPAAWRQLDTIRAELRAYASAEQTCDRASDRLQEVARKCQSGAVELPEPAPPTDRSPNGYKQ